MAPPRNQRDEPQVIDVGRGVADGSRHRLQLVTQITEQRLDGGLPTPHPVDGVERLPHHLPETRELLRHVAEGVQLLGHVVELGGELLQRRGHLLLNLRQLATRRQDKEMIGEKKKIPPNQRLWIPIVRVRMDP